MEEAWLGLQGALWTQDAVDEIIEQADYQHRVAEATAFEALPPVDRLLEDATACAGPGLTSP